MADQEKIESVIDDISIVIEKAKLELAEDLLKLKDKVTTDEFIEAISKLDVKAILSKKIEKAKQLFISHHKTILKETIPFGDIDATK